MPKATLISVVPFLINEHKPLFPGVFFIPGVKNVGDINVLVVDGDPIHYVYVNEHMGSLKMVAPVEDVCAAVVSDYIRSCICVDDEARPGFGWCDGEISVEMLKKEPLYTKIVLPLMQQQNRWFKNLVAMADDDWSKYHQHRAISDVQRHAAKSLGLDREWIINVPKPENFKTCPACNQTVSIGAVICSFCRCILNPEAAKKMSFAIPA